MSSWMEIFQGEDKTRSMPRVLMFATWFPATAIAIYIHTTESLSVYLGAFVLNSIGNKAFDVQRTNKNAKSDSSVSE